MSVSQLRAATYLCPSLPVELFQTILEALEKGTGCQTTLQYEWRSDGPVIGHPDPFVSNLLDLAFMPGSGYLKLEEDNIFAELLPVTPMFEHPMNEKDSIGTFIDVIIHVDKLKHNVKDMTNLRGCRWACIDENSLAYRVMMKNLYEMGENENFFGGIHKSKSHLESVNAVLNKKVDVAVIDSSALICNRRDLYNGAEDLAVLTSFGPFSPHAILVNSRLPEKLKKKIVKILEEETSNLEKYDVIQFVPNSPSAYTKEKDIMRNTKSKIKNLPYY